MKNITRSSGVLLHLTSLPGPFGCGRLGEEAISFAKLAKACGFAYWQVLPFGPPAAGDSPYQCYSAFAGNPLLIDPRDLAEHGLLSAVELEDFAPFNQPHSSYFSSFRQINEQLLRNAFNRQSKAQRKIMLEWSQAPDQACWLPDYALFMSIRRHYLEKPWWQWPDKALKQHDQASLDLFWQRNSLEVEYYLFEQYQFDRQWQKVKQAIHSLGIQIIGDMPIYVAHDSADIWANHHLFQLDDKLQPLAVAGVPPDYFSDDGQLWGNPLYDWPAHEKTGFDWWLNRLHNAFHLYDVVRLDHFRGFVDYWSVPADAKTARKGKWEEGPGHKLFDLLFDTFPEGAIIAEDLGEIDDRVHRFIEETQLPGMRVMQFGFDQSEHNTHMPCFYPAHSVAYTGTHDNNTILGWLWESSQEDRQLALDYVGLDAPDFDWGRGGADAPAIRGLIRCLWSTAAALVIVPVQDMLGYGADTRMNTPGIATGQWRFRVTEDALKSIDAAWWRKTTQVYRRSR